MLYVTLTSEEKCPTNPWNFDESDQSVPTLEWTVTSPPAFHTFEEIPAIKSPQQIAH
jgi:cytochrome c oxidase subunit I